MNLNFSCINMEYSSYLKNLAENTLRHKALLLICPPLEADMTIRAVKDVRWVSIELLTLDGALFYIESSGADVHKVISQVIDLTMLKLNQHESRLRAVRREMYENVIEIASWRQNGKGARRSN